VATRIRLKPDSPQSVWLDTDIGDDTDDILALALICGSPELSLAGVSTVLGDTAARARLAQTFLQVRGGDARRIPVAAGCGHPLPGKITPHFWPNDSTPREWMAQRACAWPAKRLPRPSMHHGVDLLAAHLRKNPRTTIPIAIGPMTNLATLLLRAPELKSAIPRIVAMSGEFQRPQGEWNVQCDPLAAACVFESGLPVDIVPWTLGMQCTVSTRQLGQLFACASPTAQLLSRAIRLWQKAKSRPNHLEHPHLFDPMAVSTLLNPDWFTWRRGRIRVSFAPRTFAHTQFERDPRGPHRIAWAVRPEAVNRVWARIVS
jgi:inosine-uridine nucleoside N-ribohydrolase